MIKLTPSLPVPVLFRCNPPRFRPVTLIFELPTMSNFSADRCSFTLFTLNVAFPLSVLLTKFDIHTFDWGNVFSIKLFNKTFTTPYRLDRYQTGGGIMLYITEDIPSKSLTEIKLDNEIENIFIEINLR